MRADNTRDLHVSVIAWICHTSQPVASRPGPGEGRERLGLLRRGVPWAAVRGQMGSAGERGREGRVARGHVCHCRNPVAQGAPGHRVLRFTPPGQQHPDVPPNPGRLGKHVKLTQSWRKCTLGTTLGHPWGVSRVTLGDPAPQPSSAPG